MNKIFLLLLMIISLSSKAEVWMVYFNRDTVAHTLEVKIDDTIQKIHLKANYSTDLTIPGKAHEAIIYSKCGKLAIKYGHKINVKNACASILGRYDVKPGFMHKPAKPVNHHYPTIAKPPPPKRKSNLMVVEEMPEFEGGAKAFAKFIRKQMKYPKQAKKMGVEGKVYLEFIVNKDSSLSDIKILKGIGLGCEEEAIRLLKKSESQWTAGKQRGKPVKVKMSVAIVFKIK